MTRVVGDFNTSALMDSKGVPVTRCVQPQDLHQSKPQNPYTMDNVFKFMGGFFSSLTQLLIGFAALAVVTEVVFGAEMFPGMTVVDNLTSLITTLGNGGFVGLVALLILWNILSKK